MKFKNVAWYENEIKNVLNLHIPCEFKCKYTLPAIKHNFVGLLYLMVFSFLPKNVHFITKNAISCLFLKNDSRHMLVASVLSY